MELKWEHGWVTTSHRKGCCKITYPCHNLRYSMSIKRGPRKPWSSDNCSWWSMESIEEQFPLIKEGISLVYHGFGCSDIYDILILLNVILKYCIMCCFPVFIDTVYNILQLLKVTCAINWKLWIKSHSVSLEIKLKLQRVKCHMLKITSVGVFIKEIKLLFCRDKMGN